MPAISLPAGTRGGVQRLFQGLGQYHHHLRHREDQHHRRCLHMHRGLPDPTSSSRKAVVLAALEMQRGKNVYIANVLKCRPPGNRNPAPEEVARCAPHLLRQVALVRPKLILLMGRFAAQTVLASDASLASLRGRLHHFAGVPAVVTYHPAYLLRAPTEKARAWEDLLFARAIWLGLQLPGDTTN